MGDRSEGEAETIDALRAEVAALRARGEALEREVGEAQLQVARLQAILNIFPGVIWESWIPEPGKLETTFINPKGVELLGYSEQEWRETDGLWVKMLHPDDRDRLLGRIAAGELNGPSAMHRLVGKQGQVVWMEPYIQRISAPHEMPARLCGVALDITERVQAEQARAASAARTQELAQTLDDLIASVPGAVWEMRGTADSNDLRLVFVSEAITPITGYSVQEYLEVPDLWSSPILPEDAARMERDSHEISRRGSGSQQYRVRTKDGRIAWLETHVRVAIDPASGDLRARGVTMDITARKQAEEQHAELREAVIRAQAAALEALSTPLIPISDAILVMPLIGTIDERRAARVLETLLEGISKSRARFAIVDITGVSSVDGATAEALLRAARGVRLLGAEVVLTGIRPEVAQTLVALGQDLTHAGIVTRGSLEGGIAYASQRR